MTLAARSIRATAWIVGGYGTAQVLRLASNLIMTRLLVPEMFGLIAIVMSIYVGITMMSDLGIRVSVIQHERGEEESFLRTAWSLQIIRGFAIWGLAVLAAGLVALGRERGIMPENTIYANPVLPSVIVATCFAAVLSGLESINIHVAGRNLVMGRLTALELTAQVIAIPVMIVWALKDPSIWAIVAGGLTGALVRTIGSHLIIPGPRYRPGWDPASFWEMFHFGKWIFLSSTTGFFVQHGDRLLIGGMLASREMGLYAIAILLAEAARNLFSRIVGSVVFPAISEAARDSTARLSSVYYKYRTRADPILFLVAGMVAVLGDDLVRLLYDDRYVEAGWMLQILSASIFLSAFEAQGSVLLALGKSRILAILTTTGGALLLISIPLFYHYFGVIGAVAAASVRLVWSVPIGFWAMWKLDILRLARELLFTPVALIGVGAGLVIERLFF